ncbi:MAG: hypothetical protein KBC15_04185 [Candidatus Levybacteria bacterium]|nr:hypothetical protein [Candidatus Levybacteria bacterium]
MSQLTSNVPWIIGDLESCGALRRGHFRLTSGGHTGTYLEVHHLLQAPVLHDILCRKLAQIIRRERVNIILAPPMGGIPIAVLVANKLGMPVGWAEKTADGGLTLPDVFKQAVNGGTVVIIDDWITTGGSINEVKNLVQAADGEVVQVAALINKSPSTVTSVTFGAPLVTLENFPVTTWSEADCPLCAEEKIPIDPNYGHGM